MCLGMFLFGLFLNGTLWALDWGDYSFSHVREVFEYNILKYFHIHFLFLFFSWDCYKSNVGVFNVVPEVSETVHIPFHSFFSEFCSCSVTSTTLSSSTHIYISILLPQLFCYWFSLVHFLFQLFYCSLLIVCSLLLLGPCEIFLVSSQFVPQFSLSVLFILFLRFSIIFTIATLNYFSARFYLLFIFLFCEFLPCSFIFCMLLFLILFILLTLLGGFLSIGCRIVESSPSGWGWTRALRRLPDEGNLCLSSDSGGEFCSLIDGAASSGVF